MPRSLLYDPRRSGIVQLGGGARGSRTSSSLQAALSSSSDDSMSDSESDSSDPGRLKELSPIVAMELPRYELMVPQCA